MKKSKTLISLATAAILSMSLAACGNGAGAEEGPAAAKSEFKISLNQTEEHPNYIALTQFAEKVEERTEGRISMEVFPNAVLGAQQETVQMVSNGSVDMASLSGTQMTNLNKDFQVLDMPGVFADTDHQAKVINNQDVVGDLYRSVEESQNMVVVGGYTQGERHMYNGDKPINTPADLAGMKIRIQESDLQIRMIEALGGEATPMAFGEVYTGLQSGVLDAAENNILSYYTTRHFEVAPYFSKTNHLIGVDLLVINADVLEGFSDEDEAIFREEYLASVEHFNSVWEEMNQEAQKKTEEGGAQFNDADQAAFQAILTKFAQESLATETQLAIYEQIQELR